MKVVVVGAGSIGAHIGHRLQAQGAEVEIVEASVPARGTSSASFAWLSSFPQMSWTEEAGRAALRPTVHPRFHELEDELGSGWLQWSGTLTWGAADERGALRDAALACRERGVALDTLDAGGARASNPGLDIADDDEFVFEHDSGWVDAPLMIERLLVRFRELGGILHVDSPVTEVRRTGDRITGVVTKRGEVIEGDAVVNAAGSWGTHIAALAGVALPLDLVPGLMIYTEPVDPAAVPGSVLNSPTWLSRPDPSGGLAIHWRGEGMTNVHGANGWSVERVVADVARTLPALRGVGVARSRVGIRPIPPGGPIVGTLPWAPGMYHALSHGGIGWGPIWGDLVARELLGEEVVPELAGMRPERFYLQTSSLGRFADDAEQPSLAG
jgi:glycine/D-amino acid oxidase-like deaminating enzyme